MSGVVWGVGVGVGGKGQNDFAPPPLQNYWGWGWGCPPLPPILSFKSSPKGGDSCVWIISLESSSFLHVGKKIIFRTML